MSSRKSPAISVVMSVYNSATYLKDAIESILDQTFEDFEFIIIDDGSTDNSVDIIKSYKDQRIVFLQNYKNIGLAKSLNKGISIARGKYIARMDADDISYNSRLEKQFQYMEDNEDIAISGSWIQTIGEKVELWKYPTSDKAIKSELIFNSALAHPSIIFRKNMFQVKNLYYDESIDKAQDYELWSRVAQVYKISNIPEVLLGYRLHAAQAGKLYRRNQSNVAKIVRYSLLRKLGISFDESEYKIHERLSCHQAVPPRSASEWLEKLIEGNNKSKFVDPAVFNKYIAEKYWNSFLYHDSWNHTILLDFFNSPLSRYLDKSYLDYMKLLYNIFKKGLW